ncbi:unnamed protein product [Soboliphyme baturini]|uniref:Aminotran_5 domain-containing protein n=1 Tax=Soboliphyme baturini TaxID=241478 RepID=A0A183IJH5_9BILA|nr:unnamed protein product [Soboliphyme baturini]
MIHSNSTQAKNEQNLRTEDIVSTISRHGRSLAVILLSGIHYYTGEYLDIEAVTKAGHAQGCIVSWDLAHAAGNVPLKLHDWNVDFAVWCTYKYMNSSPGGIGVAFVHNKFSAELRPKLWGWWGHDQKSRFEMSNRMEFAEFPDCFRISNPPMLLLCPLMASLEIFSETSMNTLRTKSLLLTGYLEYLLDSRFRNKNSGNIEECFIITPRDPERRGCQLSLSIEEKLQAVFGELRKRGVACDIRLPKVLRVSPVPLYNSFMDIRRFIRALEESFKAVKSQQT